MTTAPTTSSFDLAALRAELEQALTQEESAERARIARETEHQRRIAELNQQIAAAAEQERQARFEEAVEGYSAPLAANRQAAQQLREALPSIVGDLLNALLTHVDPVKASYEATMAAADRAIEIGLQNVEQRAPAVPTLVPPTPGVENLNTALLSQIGREFDEYTRRLPSGLTAWAVLAEAIAREQNPQRKRALQALYWLLYGEAHNNVVMTFGEGYNAQTEAEKQTQEHRRRKYSGQRVW